MVLFNFTCFVIYSAISVPIKLLYMDHAVAQVMLMKKYGALELTQREGNSQLCSSPVELVLIVYLQNILSKVEVFPELGYILYAKYKRTYNIETTGMYISTQLCCKCMLFPTVLFCSHAHIHLYNYMYTYIA